MRTENVVLRRYEPQDRVAVRDICADTGFLGQPIDPVFEDRETFADYLTSYYTDHEPEATFVCTVDGVVKGYVMGCRFPHKKEAYERRFLPKLVLRGLWRGVTWPYRASTWRYIWWILTQARQQNPYTPPDLPHFHFNVRPEARNQAKTRELTEMLFQHLLAHGEKKVYAQVVAYENRRAAKTFARVGFELLDTREVTKYQAYHPGKIYLFTVLKDLEKNPALYGLDLNEKKTPETEDCAPSNVSG